MTIDDALLHALMRHVSTHRGAAALADDISLSWLKIVRKFAPLIGANSVLLIFERSLQHNMTAFDWLPEVAFPTQPEAAVERLRACMATRASDELFAAHRAVLATFADLMTTLIGARLTVQFLRAAFPADDADSSTEENPA